MSGCFKNPKIKILFDQLQNLPKCKGKYESNEGIRIFLDCDEKQMKTIAEFAKMLKPWRKGPFYLNELFIDSEWKSFIKWNQIAESVELYDKEIADIGCNNGYYLFEMLKFQPKTLIGFDPSEIFYTQFCFLNHFLQTNILFERRGVEDLVEYKKKFDVIFCLGVIYHRSDPIATLKALSQSLKKDGDLILDTLIIEDPREIALFPKESYAKMKNIYFIPSISALESWCYRAKLEIVKVLNIKETTTQEQRKTPWIDSLSLDSFLDSSHSQTIEGYPLPKRGYFKIKRR